MINEKDITILQSAFKRYYFEHFNLIHVPNRTSEREFGYQKFNFGMTRHISLKNDNDLRLLLMNNIPSDVYCSNGYYSFPNLPMAEKDWKEADLIFDIDAKDLNLECRSSHICHKCNNCDHVFQNEHLCPNCNSNKFNSKSLSCRNCISMAKNEVVKLSNILIEDFGINENEIQIYFSGNEGFHVQIENSNYQKIGSRERSEIVDYIMLKNIMPERLGVKKYKFDKNDLPEINEKGWRGRIAKEIFGSKSKRSKIISEIMTNGYSTFQNTLIEIAPKIGAIIDPNVTMDIHRIFRLAGTLNSKSGLTKMYCDDLSKFDPYTDACFIDDSNIEVFANCPVQFKLKNRKFGPYHNEKVIVPKFAAVYLICKGFATSV